MNKPRDALISELVAAASPVARPGQTDRTALGWLILAGATAFVVIDFNGPWRPGVLAQLAATPRFLVESLLGLGAIISLGIAAFRSGIPDPTPINRRVALALVVLAAWIALVVFGLTDPALAPSMSGKRAHCWLEALVVGAPALALGWFGLRRLWPLHGAWSGTLLGLAAGACPALLMQFACMYGPLHALLFHLLPGLVLGLIGAVLGAVALRPR